MAEPNDQLGDIEHPPWAGLWVKDPENFAPSGFIVIIQPRDVGVVELFEYETEEELQEAWVNMEQSIERTTKFFEPPDT